MGRLEWGFVVSSVTVTSVTVLLQLQLLQLQFDFVSGGFNMNDNIIILARPVGKPPSNSGRRLSASSLGFDKIHLLQHSIPPETNPMMYRHCEMT